MFWKRRFAVGLIWAPLQAKLTSKEVERYKRGRFEGRGRRLQVTSVLKVRVHFCAVGTPGIQLPADTGATASLCTLHVRVSIQISVDSWYLQVYAYVRPTDDARVMTDLQYVLFLLKSP